MNKTALKNFAMNARKELIEKVKAKAFRIGITEESIMKAQFESSDSIFIDGKPLDAIGKRQREKLISRVKELGYKQVVEEVAYTWFNRFTALRFMEVNNYLPTKVRVLSSSNTDNPEPDIIKEALTVDLDIDKEFVYEHKLNNDVDELFKYLVIKQCNSLNKFLPFMFETIDDYKEILFPDGLLAKDSFIREMTDITVIPESDWEQVEIIGWLYQFYISEKKDQVFTDLKKNIKINKENIPAATQLFTPSWIVKYMVENSLGRIWLESYPDSSLKSEWKYYLKETEQEEAVVMRLEEIRQKNVNPENITFLDPSCGSGHILVYAFDILYGMYLEKGYIDHEIPKLILEKNLFGLDIDDRAVQLASFAVLMKAREKSRRVFGQDIKLNICAIQESNWMNDEVLEMLVDEHETQEVEKKQRELLKLLRNTFEDAKEFGSILSADTLEIDFLEKRIEALETESKDIFQLHVKQDIMEKLPGILLQTRLLVQKYDVVCTNPPYMSSAGMNSKLSAYVKGNYPETKADMSTIFMEKTLLLCKPSGMVAMINIPVWMFLSTYKKLRDFLLLNKTIINMLHLGRGVFGSDFGTTAFVISNRDISNYQATYRRLFKRHGAVDSLEQKEKWFFEKVGHFCTKKEWFRDIPSSPIAYWLPDKHIFEREKLSGNFISGGRNKTHNNEKYVRFWWEVSKSNDNWVPYSNGGEYRKYYGNEFHVVNWSEEARNYYASQGGLCNQKFWGKEGLTWNLITSAEQGFRVKRGISQYSSGSPTIFSGNDTLDKCVLGFLNSKLSHYLLKILNPTLNTTVNDVLSLPYDERITNSSVCTIVEENIDISKSDWDDFELSNDYKIHPLLKYNPGSNKINDAFTSWERKARDQFNRLKSNEEELNNIFIDLYNFHDELSPQLSDKDITIRIASNERDIKSFISYAVGCMFGRYSLDEEGLVYAGGKFDEDKYRRLQADMDNVIPILTGSYLEDDIVSKFIEFLKVTFSEEGLAENLEYIAEALGKKEGETSKETIQRYFLSDFFKDHLQTYKKKPIYWLFTSGKHKAFNCLIYMHRYDKSTLSRIRTDYLHELQTRMDAERKLLLDIINGDGTTKEIVNAKKEQKLLDLKIEELRAYEEKLHHMADMQIEIDFDDGVAINYAKFEGLLAPIK